MDDYLDFDIERISISTLEEKIKQIPEQENRCVVRISTSYWHDKNGLYSKKSLKFLKRKCKGFNWLSEDCSIIGVDEVFPRIVNLDNCEDGVYDVIIVNESRDWETGIVDDYDYELIRV